MLTERGMPVKVLRNFNAGGNITEWYQVELFNGITGWIYHNQLSKNANYFLRKIKIYTYLILLRKDFLRLESNQKLFHQKLFL